MHLTPDLPACPTISLTLPRPGSAITGGVTARAVTCINFATGLVDLGLYLLPPGTEVGPDECTAFSSCCVVPTSSTVPSVTDSCGTAPEAMNLTFGTASGCPALSGMSFPLTYDPVAAQWNASGLPGPDDFVILFCAEEVFGGVGNFLWVLQYSIGGVTGTVDIPAGNPPLAFSLSGLCDTDISVVVG